MVNAGQVPNITAFGFGVYYWYTYSQYMKARSAAAQPQEVSLTRVSLSLGDTCHALRPNQYGEHGRSSSCAHAVRVCLLSRRSNVPWLAGGAGCVVAIGAS